MTNSQEKSGNVCVLLIDDNHAFLRVTERFLEKHDVVKVVGTADGGEKGIVLAQTLQPDIVLVDLAMPDLPGLVVIERLRNAQPGVGIIALTLLDEASYRQAALDAGADAFVPKPALVTELIPAIGRVAQKRC